MEMSFLRDHAFSIVFSRAAKVLQHFPVGVHIDCFTDRSVTSHNNPFLFQKIPSICQQFVNLTPPVKMEISTDGLFFRSLCLLIDSGPFHWFRRPEDIRGPFQHVSVSCLT
ncbi:hypothetical protein TNIN_1611 [Trichonephila inaurata madagascariensis]|uniref:Uncharacterized protein n=1 Tax=Trichonephila inaurata madagascariensis TaxID=2747483 RepID=A0A8X6Y420_9ARAC|nr:hypothetical protein TNIN_1611 [Trichonephila inaurata madagascariensis]